MDEEVDESKAEECAGRDVATRMRHGLRFPADWLRPRMWALRHNLSAYDATYVALTEMTDATALLTTDARLAAAPGPECDIELL
ncbi:MAG: hypothetical protein WKF72_12425 [Nocardioidaceae bacterium]